MASIQNRDGKYRVQVRVNKQQLSSSFSDKETAELWGRYKEDLIHEIEAFDVPSSQLISLQDAVEMKAKSMEGKSTKTLQDTRNTTTQFPIYLNRSIDSVSYDDLKDFTINMLSEKVAHGGVPDVKLRTHTRSISIRTVIKRLQYLGTIYSYLIGQGINLDNVALKVKAYILNNYKDDGE